jgi:hypothetical protein
MFRPIYRFQKKKNHYFFLELGCPNLDPYYEADSCYYQANISLDNVNKCVCKVLTLRCCYYWLKLFILGINKMYYLLI